MPEPVEGSKSYIPSLDGIRAVAVLAVIFYHLGYGWAQGGLLGVDVFFVLSGYLITDLLLAEYKRNGFIQLRTFWLRRARRLLPALFVMLFVILGWVTLFNQAQLPQVRNDLLPAIFYYSNWWFIFEHVSYFAKFGPPSPLGHLWSLAIEEQFYLIWPLVIIFVLKITKSKKYLGIITFLGIIASACEMAVLYQPYIDPTRLYDGTDTRAFALLLGALLAIYRPRDKKITVSKNSSLMANTIGIASLAGLLCMFWQTDEYSGFLYQGGMLLASILSLIIIVIAIVPDTYLNRFLSTPVLKWIGQRSYGIYIWHYPIITLTTPYNSPPDLIRSLFQIAASFTCAALSWKYIEQPVRHGAISRLWNDYRESQNSKIRPTIALNIAGNTADKRSLPQKTTPLKSPLSIKSSSLKLKTGTPPSKSSPPPGKRKPLDRLMSVTEKKPGGEKSIGKKQVIGSVLTLAITSNVIVCILAISGAVTGNTSTDYSGEGSQPTSILPVVTRHSDKPATTGKKTVPVNLETESDRDLAYLQFLATVKTVVNIPFMPQAAKTYLTADLEKSFFFDQYTFPLPWLLDANISTFNLPPYLLQPRRATGIGIRTTIGDDSGVGVTAIGDSIMIDAAPYLKKYLPGIAIDAVVGQQIWQVQAAVPQLKKEGAVGNRLIIELGTNGGYTPSELLQLINSLGHMKKIVLVTALVPDPWESEVNSSIATVARTLPNVSVVNWYKIGQKHPNYFYPDHIHLNPVGAKFYAKLIVRALLKR